MTTEQIEIMDNLIYTRKNISKVLQMFFTASEFGLTVNNLNSGEKINFDEIMFHVIEKVQREREIQVKKK